MYQHFIHFCCWTVLCCMDISHLFIYHLMDIWAVSSFGCCEQTCYKHSHARFYFNTYFSIVLSTYLRVELLGHTLTPCLFVEDSVHFLTFITVLIFSASLCNVLLSPFYKWGRFKGIKWITKLSLDLPSYNKHFIRPQRKPKWDRFISRYIFLHLKNMMNLKTEYSITVIEYHRLLNKRNPP